MIHFLGMTMYHFLSAMVDGPGYLPLGWKPKEVLKLCQIFYYLNKNMYCICLIIIWIRIFIVFVIRSPFREIQKSGTSYCSGVPSVLATRHQELTIAENVEGWKYKILLSYYNLHNTRCVQKMDHHCPWINNCVGHFNHGHFSTFLISAVLGWAVFRISNRFIVLHEWKNDTTN